MTAANDALRFYKTPYKFKARKSDSEPTKSLQDWHEHIKVIRSTPMSAGSWADRDEKIRAFHSSSQKKDTPVDPEVPIGLADTHVAAAPTLGRPAPTEVSPRLKNKK